MTIELAFSSAGIVCFAAMWRRPPPVVLGRYAAGLSCYSFSAAIADGTLYPAEGVAAIVSLMLGSYALALANTLARQMKGGAA
jgi:hypothetical protein